MRFKLKPIGDTVDKLMFGIVAGIITATISSVGWWAGFFLKKSAISNFGEGMFMLGAVLVFFCSFLLNDEFRRLPEQEDSHDQSLT